MEKSYNWPLVTVVIPTRNRPALVCRAVRSVLNQTYENIEIVVVIDGPDESTEAALNQIGSPLLRIVALGANVGGCEARNTGIRTAKGTWIALLDDDDSWLPTKIEKQVALALSSRHPDSCLVLCRFYSVREPSMRRFEQGGLPKKGEPFADFILSPRGGYQSSVLFASRSLFLRKPFTLGLRKHQDWDWLLRVSKEPCFEVCVVDEPLSEYFLGSDFGRVSNQSNWKQSVAWAKSVGLSGKAYSRFLLSCCLRSAKRQAAPLSDVLSIVREIALAGRVSLSIALRVLIVVACPDQFVNWLSDNSFRFVNRCR